MGETWANWSGDQICAPAAIERPSSEAEVAGIVAGAAASGGCVRAIGSGHSFTDCACTDGVMIDMAGMARVLDIDRSCSRVTVEGGARLHTLGPVLAEHGLALENQGDIDRQSITGAISTATHGTGARLPNIAARIVGMRIVDGTGQIRTVSEGGDRDEYLAARVSIGALGVITAVTVQCVPLYTLHRHDEPLPLRETLDRLEEHNRDNDHFEFFVFPYTDTALVRRTRRSEAEPRATPRWRRAVQEELVENVALGAVCRLGRALPRLAPRLNRGITRAMSAGAVEDRAHRVYATRRAVRFNEMEYAIPRAHARAAIERVLALVERRRLPILFPLEVRFAAGDDAFLSTAAGRDTCYVAVHQYTGMEFETYFRAVEEIMDAYGGRPHWGKRHYQTAATLRERYPGWDRFQAVRDRFDPNRVFENDYTRRVL
jgi:L-gulono-1,4-lactone dehydrogenase